MSDERTPYLKCLIHETKKAYKIWLIVVGTIAAAGGLAYVVWVGRDILFGIRDEILKIFTDIGNFITSVFSLVPWWIWLLIAIFTAPVLYAAVKCFVIRVDADKIRYESWLNSLLFTGFLIGFFGTIGLFVITVATASWFWFTVTIFCAISGFICWKLDERWYPVSNNG